MNTTCLICLCLPALLLGASPKFTRNSGFEEPLDRKGRVPFWSEEREKTLGGGTPAGKLALDNDARHSGKSSLKLTASGNWYGLSSLGYPVWPWSDQWQGRAWVRCEPGAKTRLAMIWADDVGEAYRVDQGPETTGAEWTEIATPALEPPTAATTVRLALLVTGGSAWFDDAEFNLLEPRRPLVRVLVNQVGYELAGPKSAVIATNFVPAGKTAARIEILDGQNRTVYTTNTSSPERIQGQDQADWGWYFWRADFSAFSRRGDYRVKASIGKPYGVSFPFTIDKDVLFAKTAPLDVDFFFVQRCGFEVPGWHKACHMDDARVQGTPRELTGGWHSAGDYNKLAWEYGDGAVTYALALAAKSAPALLDKFDRNRDGVADVRDEAEWGAKFLAKIQIPETGGLLGNIEQGPTRQAFFKWVPPEMQTDGVPGTADDPVVGTNQGNTPLAVAGWTLVSGMVESRELKQEYLDRAVKLLRFFEKRPNTGADPHLLIGTIELYKATRRAEFLAGARTRVRTILKPEGLLRGGYSNSGDIPSAALGMFALSFPDDPLSAIIKQRLRRQLDYLVAEPRNPFGITRQKTGKDGYFFEPTSVLGHNFIFSSRAWGAMTIYRLTGDRRAWAYAADQMDWILGKNPYNLCMMEGIGVVNPPRYHHRYNSIPGRERGAVPGAIPNGFVRDMGGFDRPGFDMSRKGRQYPSYRTSEPWLVHNILHLLSVTALHNSYVR
jgi:hypothetical protein